MDLERPSDPPTTLKKYKNWLAILIVALSVFQFTVLAYLWWADISTAPWYTSLVGILIISATVSQTTLKYFEPLIRVEAAADVIMSLRERHIDVHGPIEDIHVQLKQVPWREHTLKWDL